MIHLFDMLRLLMRYFEIFKQFLSNYSRYAANLIMKASCQFFKAVFHFNRIVAKRSYYVHIISSA